MKYFFIILISFILLVISQVACNNGSESVATKADSIVANKTRDTISTLDSMKKIALDSVRVIKEINDSFNIAIKKMNEVIMELADSSLNSSGDKKTKISSLRRDMIHARDNTNNIRNNITTVALKSLTGQLKPIVSLLKSQLLKLQTLAESVENVVSILNIVDGVLAAAIKAGVISTPVVLAANI